MLGTGVAAAEIHVTNGTSAVGDGDGCSLAEAVLNANGDDQSGSLDCPAGSGADTIVLDADVLLTSPAPGSSDLGGGLSGVPDVKSELTIRAGSASAVARDPAAPPFRILHVAIPGALTLEGLRIANGRIEAVDEDAHGGCILALAPLHVFDTVIESCSAVARVESRTATAALDAVGGGILAFDAPEMVLLRSAIRASDALGADASGLVRDGGEASGGGLAVLSSSPGAQVLLEDVELTGNRAQGGATEAAGGIGGNASGGGAFVDSEAVLRRVLVASNGAFGGSAGGLATGGGVRSFEVPGGEPLRVEASTFTDNTARTADGTFPFGFGGGLAGNLSSPDGLVVFNSTFSGNTVVLGFGGGLGLQTTAPGGGGLLDSVTVTGSRGGGVGTLSATVAVRNSIIASQQEGDDCVGGVLIVAENPNLASDGTCEGFSVPTADPFLAPLAVNAPGTTPTHALPPGSPAIDAGDTDLPEDQRGVARPQGEIDDLGAFELVAAPLDPAEVPTLGEAALVLLAALLAAAALLHLRHG